MKTKTKKTFSRLTKAQQRVAIAKDAIEQLKARRFVASPGSYIRDKIRDGANRSISQETVGGRTFRPCRVCMIGQAIVSGIRLFNKLEVESCEVSGSGLHHELKRWFTSSQAAMLEVAFEKRNVGYRMHTWTDEYSAAVNFGHHNKCRTPYSLSIAIWKNVIKNNGTFKP